MATRRVLLRLLPVIRHRRCPHRNSAHGLSLVCAHHAAGSLIGRCSLGWDSRWGGILSFWRAAAPLLCAVLAMRHFAALYYVFVQRAAARR